MGSILDLGKFMSHPISSNTYTVVLTSAAVCSLEGEYKSQAMYINDAMPFLPRQMATTLVSLLNTLGARDIPNASLVS